MSAFAPTNLKPGRQHGIALALFAALALLLTWPLAGHFTTHVTGDGIDDPALAWNLWWVKTRLVDQLNADIFHTGWMFQPIGINLAFYTLTPLNALLSIPFQTAGTPVVANNLLLLSSFVLGGFGAYLLAYGELLHWRRLGPVQYSSLSTYLAALFAGVVYAFASSKLFYASLGQFNIASGQWLPFCTLYLLRSVRARTLAAALRNAALAGLFLVFQAWAELTFASFVLIWMAILLVWQLLMHTTSGRGTHPGTQRTVGRIVPFFLVAVIFLMGISPFLWAMLPDLRAEGDFFGSGGGFADVFSADLLGYLVPTRLHPLFGGWVATLHFPNDKGQHIFTGYTTMILAVVGMVVLLRYTNRNQRRWAWFWAASILIFWLLTLGPILHWSGQELPVPGPFAIISRLPFFSGNRYPSRYSVVLMLSVAVLASAGLRQFLHATHGRRLMALFALAAGLFLFEHLSTPLPLADFQIPSIYATLAAAPDDSVVLELPTGWRNGARVLGKSDVLIMMQEWYQTAHGLRRLGGNTSRNPEYKFQYFTQAPIIGDLIALMNADRPHLTSELDTNLDALVGRGHELAQRVLDFLGVDYVLVQVEKSPPQLLRYVAEALPVELVDTWHGLDWTGSPATIRLYRVEHPAYDPLPEEVDLGGELAPLYLGEGWSPLPAADGKRLAMRREPVLLLNLPESGSQLSLDWSGPATGLTASVNGHPVTVANQEATGGHTLIKVPKGVAGEPVDQLQLHFAGSPVPAAAAIAAPEGTGWPVGTTGFVLPSGSAVVAHSAGEEVGSFAHIYVAGEDVAKNLRGYNLVAIDPKGQVLDSVRFDTFAATVASAEMAQWLSRWPTGTLIAGAVADEASMQLSAEGVRALARVGVAGDLRGKFRWSHAFVGAVGAPPGSAAEVLTLIRPAIVAAGTPVDGKEVFAAVRGLEIIPDRNP